MDPQRQKLSSKIIRYWHIVYYRKVRPAPPYVKVYNKYIINIYINIKSSTPQVIFKYDVLIIIYIIVSQFWFIERCTRQWQYFFRVLAVYLVLAMAENKDIFARITGNFGKWQLRAVLIIFLCKIPTSWFMAVVIYTAPAPKVGDYWCRPVEPHQEKWKDVYHPATSQSSASNIDYCSVYKELHGDPDRYMGVLLLLNRSESVETKLNINNTIVECQHFTFKSGFRSLIIEYELVCDRKYLLSLSQCFHIFGLLLGGILAYRLLKT